MDLLPCLVGEWEGPPHAALGWRIGKQRVLRKGDWKLLDRGGGWRLYSLAAGIAEQHDLFRQEASKAEELQAAYAEWDAWNMAPVVTSSGQGKQREDLEWASRLN